MTLPAARTFEPFRRRFPPRDHPLNLPRLVAHPFQIAHQLAAHLHGQRVVVGALGKIPRRIAPLPRKLAFDFAQRALQLRRDALQQRGTRVRRRATVANFAEREDDFQLLRVARFVSGLRLMPSLGFLHRHFPLKVGMQAADHPTIEFLESRDRRSHRGRLEVLPGSGAAFVLRAFTRPELSE